ncbi:stimulator of interferon genes protein isoform X2 [Hemitrygon akajei]|uniref:stimulator of interferon genes protein isoform X2 n=1 Tax=Hemitrygon akajei TaxID=2704970 RepID=UPI003BF96848
MFSSHIPLPRGNAECWSSAIVMFASIIYMHHIDPADVLQLILRHLLILLLSRFCKHFCQFVEEFRHIPSRYKNCWEAFRASVNLMECASGIILFLVLCYQPNGSKDNGVAIWSSFGKDMSATCFCYSLLKIMNGDHTAAEISTISEKNKLNVAHGLAWSYYIGYLKLILPTLEGRINSIIKEVPEFIGIKRLYILIPFSCKVYDRLEKKDNRIKFHHNLPEVHLDRAGIKGRSYTNSIYLVNDERGKSHHCILEYATPLQSLFEMSNDATAAISKEQRLVQAKLFYVILNNILNNSLECAGLFKLIPYDDDLEDSKENAHFLSTMILNGLKQERIEYPIPEENTWDETSNAGFQNAQGTQSLMISDPTLMISETNDPQPLRSQCQ